MKNPLSQVLREKGGTIYSVTPDTTVAEAVERMNELQIGALMVMAGDRVKGIFTERDVLVRIVAAGRDPGATTVSEVMSTDLMTVSPETTVEEAMWIISSQRVRHLPVITGEKLLGMVSINDLNRWVVRNHERQISELVSYIGGSY